MNHSTAFAIAVFDVIFGGAASGGRTANHVPQRNSRLANAPWYEDEFRALVDAELLDASESWGGRTYTARQKRPLDEPDM